MKINKKGLSIFIGILCLFQAVAWGQTISIVPNSVQNTRFFIDHFQVKRPGLSINGFDNGGNNSYGYGLKQVLNRLYAGGDSLELATYNEIVSFSATDIINPSGNVDKINNNSQYLQSRAFIALSQYIIHKNGVIQSIPGADSTTNYSNAIIRLRDALIEPASWYLATTTGEDEVKTTRSVENYARAVDLYLALENAYGLWDVPDYDDPNSDTLLTSSQKETVLWANASF